MTRKEAADYLRPIMENASLPNYQAALALAVEALELAQAEKDRRLVVHGRWISWEEAGNSIPSPDRYECSVCHDAAQRLCNGIDLLSPYCPNCGAKMDKEDR